MESKCLSLAVGSQLHTIGRHQVCVSDVEHEAPCVVAQMQAFVGLEVQGGGRVIGRVGQLAPAAVGQHRQFHRGRAAEIKQLVDCRAQRAAGEQHIVHQNDVAAIDV